MYVFRQGKAKIVEKAQFTQSLTLIMCPRF